MHWWLAKIITDIPGSSEWFTGSVVCYNNESKTSLLGVSKHSLKEFGAVSSETVMEMADGLLVGGSKIVQRVGPAFPWLTD